MRKQPPTPRFATDTGPKKNSGCKSPTRRTRTTGQIARAWLSQRQARYQVERRARTKGTGARRRPSASKNPPLILPPMRWSSQSRVIVAPVSSSRACRPTPAGCRSDRSGFTRSSMTATGCWCARPMTKFASTRGAVRLDAPFPRHRAGGGEPPGRVALSRRRGRVCAATASRASRNCTTGKTIDTVFLYAFDMLEIDGEDLRRRRWSRARCGCASC